jgi:hypothetical protein
MLPQQRLSRCRSSSVRVPIAHCSMAAYYTLSLIHCVRDITNQFMYAVIKNGLLFHALHCYCRQPS